MSGRFEKLPELIRDYASPDLPREKRLVAARGEIAVSFKTLVQILCWLTKDSDEEVSKQAVDSLNSISQDIYCSLVRDETTPPEFLDYLARASPSEEILKEIILNDATSDSTVAYLADNVHSQSLMELILNNHCRIVRSQEILEAIARNPSVSRTTMERILSLFKHYLDRGDNVQDEYVDDNGGTTSRRIKEYEFSVEKAEAESDVKAPQGDPNSFFDEIELSHDLIDETQQETSEVKHETMLSKIRQMNMGEKLKLSMLGNREARGILIRDSNRIIACAVLKNPMITESEIVLTAQSKIVDDEILRLIADSRKWIRLYQVKYALICNPRTPSHIALNFIRHIRDRDLKGIMNDKNLPGIVTKAAMRIFMERVKGKR